MYKKEITDKRTYKALFLLNLLSQRECSKKEIVEEFAKNQVEISKTSVTNYIEKLRAYNIPVTTRRVKNTDLYFLNKKDLLLDLDAYEVHIAHDVKKLLSIQKDHETMRKAMQLFYKFALLTPDNGMRQELADFGYFSTINWDLVKELEDHCQRKDIIEIDYILPDGSNRPVIMHADSIHVGGWSQRLYFRGVFNFAHDFSSLPIDKIYMVRRVVDDMIRFDMETTVLTYKVAKEIAPTIEIEKSEEITGYEGDLAVIKRPVDDSFKLIQKLLYCCPDLYHISDELVKKRVEEKLYIIRDMYCARPDD